MATTHMANAFDPRDAGLLAPPSAQLLARRDRVMGAAYRLFYREPIHVVRGEGVHLYDAENRAYLDAYNNVPVVGHSNPLVQSRVAEQLGVLNTHTRYLTDAVVEYAERLTGLFPDGLDQVVFACSGSEAVDLALRIARIRTSASGVIATRHAYHGTTIAAAEVSPSLGPGNVIPDNIMLVEVPDPVRDPDGDRTASFRDRVIAAADELERRGHGVAALLIDSALSSDGLVLDPIGFLADAVEAVRARGGLYIADEVQAGFARLGGKWWGFERHAVMPDLVVLGKPMGNGIPISAVVARPVHLDDFGGRVRYFNTFGGNPVSIAAATAVLDEFDQRGLVGGVSAVGELLGSALCDASRGVAGVAPVRGEGLFWAVELVGEDGRTPDAARASAVVNAMRDRRVLVSASGRYSNVIKIRPPLIFGAENVHVLVEALSASLDDTAAAR